MLTLLVVASFAVFGATEMFGNASGIDWTQVITKLLQKHQEDFNAKDVKALASEYEAAAHRLAPGQLIDIGREAIEESYLKEVVNNYLEKLEMTDLRFSCDEGAVAEFVVVSRIATVKGVLMTKMVDEVAKVSTVIVNTVQELGRKMTNRQKHTDARKSRCPFCIHTRP